MHKFKKLPAGLLFLLFFSGAFAQQKYAVLVGINQYYVSPGVPYESALQGCVNDALAIKGMLIQRFGFYEEGIITVFDQQATRQHVLDALTEILNKCKAGDAVVFFFSGHGVWMNNAAQDPLDEQVKKGMNQAMVMSDLYAPNLDCLFTDAMVKRMFNKFVDKKVVLTAIFDCCFSGKISMVVGVGGKNPYDYPTPSMAEKSMSYGEVLYAWQDACSHRPEGCDMNGINAAWHNELAEDSIADISNNTGPGSLPDSNTRSFNLKDKINISSAQRITRPSERPNSMFLSLAATNDVEKGLEIMDETGTYHGAFTKALLFAMANSTADVPVGELIKKVNAAVKRQLYSQSPMNFQNADRLNKNLLGITPERFSNTIVTKCTGIKGKLVQLDAGLYDGLAKGNKLTVKKGNNNFTVQVTDVSGQGATAKLTGGNVLMIQPGDIFTLTDGYRISAPIIKVYIPGVRLSAAAFDTFFAKNIIPLAKLDNYWDYKNWYADKASRNIFFNEPAFNPYATAKQFTGGLAKDNFLTFLPIPDYISASLQKIFRYNQNIQLVKDASQADVTLYLNYTKGAKPAFVFTWYNFRGSEMNQYALRFDSHYVSLPDMHPNSHQLRKLSLDLLNMTLLVARGKSSQWMNDYPARD